MEPSRSRRRLRAGLDAAGRRAAAPPEAATNGRAQEKPTPDRRAPRAGSRATRRTSRSAGSRSTRTRCSTTR